MSPIKFWKRNPAEWLSVEDVDDKFLELWYSSERFIKIANRIKSLVWQNFISKRFLDIFYSLWLMDHKKYREFIQRRNNFLKNHEEHLSKKDFIKLFGDWSVKSNKQDYLMWLSKYKKSEIEQWWTWECGLITGLEIFKKTPFFETMIRCSLKRNKNWDWWMLLSPLCNSEWIYNEIKDKEIEYFKQPHFRNGRWVISDSSLWFNILESIFIKEYLRNIRWYTFEDLRSLDLDLVGEAIKWFSLNYDIFSYFLGKSYKENCVQKDFIPVQDCSSDVFELLLELNKTWIVKFWFDTKIPNREISDHPIKKVDSTRWYKIDVLYEAVDDNDFSIGKDDIWRECFYIKSCDERFIDGHEYSIERSFKKDNKTYVVVKNPRFTGKELIISLDQLKSIISIFSAVVFDIDNMFVDNK